MIGTTEIIIIIVFALLLIPVILIGIFILVKLVSGKKDKVGNDSKNCPFCAELIQSEAVVCRFCQRNI